MHNMKKLILSVFIFTFGFATATHAQQVNTLLTKKLPEASGKEIEVITVNYPPGAVDTIHLGSYRRGDTLWDIAYRRLQNTNGLRPLRSSAFVIWGQVLPHRPQTFGDNLEELRIRKQRP
jgi:hypothetical protein